MDLLYGADKQQQTYTIEVIWSDGLKIGFTDEANATPTYGKSIRIRARNLYGKGCIRMEWEEESSR